MCAAPVSCKSCVCLLGLALQALLAASAPFRSVCLVCYRTDPSRIRRIYFWGGSSV